MPIDKNYCASSFLAFRYIYDDNKNFGQNLEHRLYHQHSDDKKTFVRNAEDINAALQKVFDSLKGKNLEFFFLEGWTAQS